VTRVLHVSETTGGGVGVIILALARFQVAAGHDVHLATPSRGPVIGELERIGVRCYGWEAVPAPGPGLPGELRSLAAIVRTVDPEMVHLHSSKAGMIGRVLIRRRRATIMHPHAWSFFAKTGGVQLATLQWERIGARWADVILTESEDERRLGIESGINAREYRVLPNGVDLTRFTAADDAERRAAREKLGLPVDAPIAVCTGRLHRQKNQAALLDIWPRVRDAVPGARLELVGDGPDRGELEERAVEGVDLVGQQSDVRAWMAAASLIAQPSRWEGMSLALLEALATARSVVVTDVPGMAEVVVDGVGAVVPPEDPAALEAAVVGRLRDPELADAEGRAGRRRAEVHHDLSKQHAAIMELYDEILARRKRERS
jgi:glycosyltransferase involved in cell wall biosynthesis